MEFVERMSDNIEEFTPKYDQTLADTHSDDLIPIMLNPCCGFIYVSRSIQTMPAMQLLITREWKIFTANRMRGKEKASQVRLLT